MESPARLTIALKVEIFFGAISEGGLHVNSSGESDSCLVVITTSCPASRSSLLSADPTNPLPPVIRTFIMLLYQNAGAWRAVPLLVKIILQHRGLLISEVTEFTIAYGFLHFPEELQKEMDVMNGIKPH